MILQHWNSPDSLESALNFLASNRLFTVLCLSVVALLLWRIWRFSIRPRLYPQEPQEYPYWIPYLGHIVPFLQNSEALFSTARKHFDEHDHAFTITLAGQKVYVVTDPRIVGLIFNNTTNLSFNSFLHDIMAEFGTSEAGIRAILEVPTACSSKTDGRSNKSVSQKAHDLQVRQTSGHELQELGACMMETFQQMLSVEPVSTYGKPVPSHDLHVSVPVVWLKAWTADCFIKAGQRAYFGDLLGAIDPSLPAALMEMDDLSWQIFYKYPKICRPQLNRLCEQIMAALRTYLATPETQRPAPAWFTLKLEQEYRMAGLSDEDIATQLLFLYWGINTNISKVGFWIIVHLLKNPDLVDQIRKETAPAFTNDSNKSDSEHIYRNCPLLNAIWLETLRVSAASTALRGITQDFVLGDKLLRAGNKVLVSARQLHLRTQEFGSHPNEFDHRRFLHNPSLERSPAFRPFGGGPTMCPGRLLAKHMTLNFVALLYHRFDVVLDGDEQKMPRYEEGKPSIGIMGGEGDLRVRLVPRGNV